MFFRKYIIFLWLLLCLEFVSVLCRARNNGSARGESCRRPKPVENAALMSKYGDIEKFNDTDTVEYKCNIGYTIEGRSRERKCNKGRWSRIRFKCNLILCTYVARPEHGKRLDANNGAGQFTNFECNVGYKMNGPSRILCRTDGRWKPSKPPTCNPILCPDLPNIQHGSIFQDTSDGIRNNYESVSEYTCKRGYLLYGNPRKQKYTRECRADGTWSGEEPYCDIPRCKHIEQFYGGEIVYFGERRRWSQAFYSCYDDFSIVPNNVESSECTGNIEWVPAPPSCYKKAKVKIPDNCYIKGKKDILLHEETYNLYYYSGYEFRDRDRFLEQKQVQITNKNGTLDPEVPICEEARCDPADKYLEKAIVEDEDGSKVTSKILSQTKVRLTCKDGYDYYKGGKPLNKPVIRRCEKGTIKRAPVCEEARCLFPGYPSNRNTYHRKHRDGRNYVVRDQYIYAREKIEVICRNKEDYELYVNSTETYLDTFSSECKFGQFDDAKGFPICLEKRCHFKPDRTVCLSTSGKGKCENEDFKVQSGTTVSIQCREGYTLYRSEDGSSVEANNNTSITCSKGTYFQGFKCIPDSRLEKILQFAKGKLEQVDKVIDRFTCKFSIFGFSACSDPCLVPKIPFGFAKSVKFGDKLSGEVEHGKQITIHCGDGYDLSERMTTKCKFGEWETERFPSCSPKPCPLTLKPGTSFWVDSELLTEDDGVQRTFENGTKVDIECAKGYEMKNLKTKTKIKTVRRDSTCVLGTWTHEYSCGPESCSVPVVHDAIIRPKASKTYKHNDKIEVICRNIEEYELYDNSAKTYLETFRSECKFGQFNDVRSFPVCLEKRCHFKPDIHVCLSTSDKGKCENEDFKVQSGTTVSIQCREGYTLYRSVDGSSVQANSSTSITCSKGTYFQGFKCIPDSLVEEIIEYAEEKLQQVDKVIDRFTCRFSIFVFRACSDPCLVPKIHFGFAKAVNSDDKISGEVEHETQMTVQCGDGYDLSKQMTTTCKFGEWDIDRYPNCSPKSCQLFLKNGTYFWVDSKLLTADHETQKTIENGTKLDIKCANGYEMKNLKTEAKVKNVRRDSTCVLGTWTHEYSCDPEPCSVPVVHDASIRTKATESYEHKDKIVFECDAGHHFVGSSTTNEIKKFMSVCKLGNWSNDIPTGCQPDSCKLSTLEGSRYYLANGSEEITTTRWIEHDANVLLQCMDNFDVFGKDNIIVKETNSSPGATCYQGQWVNVHHCKNVKCVVYNVTNGYVVRKGENITAGETVAHNENVTVKCENYKDLSITCNHGKWRGSIDCVGESSIATTETTIEPENESTTPYAAKTTEDSNKDSTVTDESHQVKDEFGECMLSSDKKYTYKDDRGVTILQGSVISSGTTLTVTCTEIDYYELLAGEGDYSDDTHDPTVTCTGNELSNIDLDCTEVQPATCMELQNGRVTQSFSTYYVSCDEGFSLDLILPEKNECICKGGELKSVVGNQNPACIPDNCDLPFEIDDRMSVFNKYRVSLSGGSTVDNEDYVYFNCSKVDEQKYEPLNRRFKCLKGQWLEDEKDSNWKFGNNGAFPTCREAKCEPVCANGGVCYKDNSCKCKHLTTGDQCEKVLCDDQCIENGGTCNASGKCSCPARRFGNNCERKGCTLPEHSAKPNNPKIMYQAGQILRQSDFESKHGYSLSSPAGMKCQDDGTWSDIVHYIKAVVYLIRVKTFAGRLTGTNARVYIYLHGLKGETDKIYLTGSFESGNLDESRRAAKDIRPITSVEIGHDGGGLGPGWNLEYASIYVENMNEYYVFRQNEPVWVYQGDNVVLPIHGNCISSFDEGHTWYPKWEKIRASGTYFIGEGSTMSRRACQQRCTELTAILCKRVYYRRDTHTCWGLAVSDVSYFTVKEGRWESHVYIRSCK